MTRSLEERSFIRRPTRAAEDQQQINAISQSVIHAREVLEIKGLVIEPGGEDDLVSTTPRWKRSTLYKLSTTT